MVEIMLLLLNIYAADVSSKLSTLKSMVQRIDAQELTNQITTLENNKKPNLDGEKQQLLDRQISELKDQLSQLQATSCEDGTWPEELIEKPDEKIEAAYQTQSQQTWMAYFMSKIWS